MATEPELLRSVIGNPDVEPPRLAYADWCAGQPDSPTQERSDFIRTQLDIARLPIPADVRLDYRLHQHSDELRRKHGAGWARGITAMAGGYAFHRGFVELVAMSAREFLARGAEVFSMAPVRHLDITGVREVGPEFFASPLLRRIRSLDLSRNGLTDQDVAGLAGSPELGELRWLSLAENSLGFDAVGSLAASGTLVRLAYANFFGNEVEPNEQYSFDSGLVMDTWLPEDGVTAERRYGARPWLHHRAHSAADVVPDRFRIPGAGRQVTAANGSAVR